MVSRIVGADVRGWLEAAIADSNATLSPASSSNMSNPKVGAESLTEKEVIEVNQLNGHDKSNGLHQANAVSQVEKDEDDRIDEITSFKRKLATVRRVTAVNVVNKSHYVATIDGWKVVFKKSKKIERGSWVLFFEADAFLPAHTQFDDLFSEVGPVMTFKKEEGYRVGTTTWTDWGKNKIISQGHIFPLFQFPDIDEKVFGLHCDHHSLTEEQFGELIRELDFSDELGVKKWEAFPEEAEDADGVLAVHPKPPAFILKTAMQRAQNCPNLFTKPKYRKFTFQESLKMDGANMTVYFVTRNSAYFSKLAPLPTSNSRNYNWDKNFVKFAVHPNGRLGVCSRNHDLLPHLIPDPANGTRTVYWTTALSARLYEILPRLNQDIAIQAELVGADIQGNPYSYPAGKHELFVFSIFDIATSMRWSPWDVERFAADHDLNHVPVLGYYPLPAIAQNHQDLLDRAELKKGEGLVFKNCDDGRWFKVLSNRWILEKDEMFARRNLSGPSSSGGTGTRVAAAQTGGGNGGDWLGECSREEIEKIRAIMVSLEDWVKREDGLEKWLKEWQQGMHRQKEEAEARSTNSVATTAAATTPATATAATGGGARNHGNGNASRNVGYSAERARQIAQWLGI
ncbi:uncharacterized protein B0T15DRAFT_142883 [Chaetomium strumarium]|uniref:RNA ligase domain-containing protein n=1 Tax=Chaetomium strumarium TaxID=1170767 RepID=A0AAJ0M2N1_9PEZI|nr:hypothetical protein B0T15DRAFT_142883 [Chaetomium strumarium]